MTGWTFHLLRLAAYGWANERGDNLRKATHMPNLIFTDQRANDDGVP